MKKALLAVIAMLTITYGYSQTEKGKVFIGGLLSISGSNSSYLDSGSNNSNISSRFSLTPNVGFFISDNFAVGASINYEVSNNTVKYENVNSSIYNQNSTTDYTYGIGVFARKYYNNSSLVFHDAILPNHKACR